MRDNHRQRLWLEALMFKQVLVPIDGSRLSEQALDYAAEMAKRFDARVTLVFAFEGLDHLAQALAARDGEIDRTTWERVHHSTDEGLAAARAYLDSRTDTFTARGIAVEAVVVDARRTSPAAAILAEAERQPDTVIVMSTHGRGGLRRIIFGSTAKRIVETAACPVLMVRAKDHTGKGEA
jgi:nucleotide-binding universal stress UspA family protein